MGETQAEMVLEKQRRPLVVEISNESLHHDRTVKVKQRLYARCGIPEYWILALPDARLDPTGTQPSFGPETC